jgi:hypothetical protein
VIYWDHEEDTVTYISYSFIDYLIRITELGCVGTEKWQFEYFLSDSGLMTENLPATKWKGWLETFKETKVNDVKDDMKKLVAFVIYRNKLDLKSLEALQQFNRDDLFNYLKKELYKRSSFRDQNIVCKIIGKVLGDYVEGWVRSLWKSEHNSLDTRLRSYLTAKCLNKASGLNLVFNFLEKEYKNGVRGYEALPHLEGFRSRDVIIWMESHVKYPVDGWEELFLKSSFSWDDLKRWTSLEERHEVTVINALEKYVHERETNNKYSQSIKNLPNKSQFIDFLLKLRDSQVLKKRVRAIENVINYVDMFY